MKKLLAIILSVICVFSCFALPSSAVNGGGVVGELAGTFFEGFFDIEIEEDTPIGYGVIYDMETLSGVSIVYQPSPTVSFNNPGIYTITSDTPLSVDYEFVRWEDSKGNPYYAGDKIYVDGTVTLYAVWVEKNDNDVRVARIIKTTFEALKRLIGKFFGIFDIIVNFEPTLTEPGVYDLTLNEIYYDDADFNVKEGNERVLFYIDSYGFQNTGLVRIDKTAAELNNVTITLCTGWSLETTLPLDEAVYEGLSYSFAELKGPNGEDVLIIPTVKDGADIVSEYFSANPDADKIYMTVTVNDSLYSSSKADTGLEYDEKCNPVSVVFTLKK